MSQAPNRVMVVARLRAQLLAGRRAAIVADVVRHILAVQAQDDRGARLAIRSRSAGLTASDVDGALSDDRSVVVSWLNRGTLHLVATDDYWWLHALTTPQLRTGNGRRLRQEGVTPKDAARGIDVVADAVSTDGPQTRAQLRHRLDDARVPTAGQALVHVLFAATLEGCVVRGPMIDGDHAFVSAIEWVGERPAAPDDHDELLARLARRYLAGHGPASPGDLAKWAGVRLGDARRAFAAIASETSDTGVAGVVLGARLLSGSRLPGPRLLGAFDPVLHGWVSRDWLVGPHGRVVTSNGVFRPTALVDGRVVATWGLARGAIRISAMEPLPARVTDALIRDADDVRRFLDLPRGETLVE
jgi:hypothetical protein